MLNKAALLTCVCLSISPPAFGYMGPGMAVGAVAAIFGILFAILLGLVGIIYFPAKRRYLKFRQKAQKASVSDKNDLSESD